jgi:hypothetical protein
LSTDCKSSVAVGDGIFIAHRAQHRVERAVRQLAAHLPGAVRLETDLDGSGQQLGRYHGKDDRHAEDRAGGHGHELPRTARARLELRLPAFDRARQSESGSCSHCKLMLGRLPLWLCAEQLTDRLCIMCFYVEESWAPKASASAAASVRAGLKTNDGSQNAFARVS